MAGIVATLVTVPTMELVNRHIAIEQEYTQSYRREIEMRNKYRLARELEDKQYERIAKAQYESVKEEQEEKERMKNYTYRTIKELKQKTGLNVVGFEEKNITITFYGDTYEQNGGYPNITCTGEKLKEGMVASNVYPLGTKIEWEGRVYTVADRGGSDFNSFNRLDVFLPRRNGENDKDYIKRIYDNGKRTVKATVLKIK